MPSRAQPWPAETSTPDSLAQLSRQEPDDDEVPLGVAPPPDPVAGLPSSHIMADAFQLWGTGPRACRTPFSSPVLVHLPWPIPLLPVLAAGISTVYTY